MRCLFHDFKSLKRIGINQAIHDPIQNTIDFRIENFRIVNVTNQSYSPKNKK